MDTFLEVNYPGLAADKGTQRVKITIVDEVQTGGTISAHTKLLNIYVQERALRGRIATSSIAFARTDGGEFQQAQDYDQLLRNGKMEVISGKFPTIDVPLLLPLVARGGPNSYGDGFKSHELLENMGNRHFENLLRVGVDNWYRGKATA